MIDDRQELRRGGTEVCHRLAQEIEQMAPEGIGRWERTWEIVADADSKFMIALVAWETEPSDPTKMGVKCAYSGCLAAWRQAIEEYQREGASR